MVETYNIIHDEAEIRRTATRLFPVLTEDEAIFISLSARNKYLNEEERKHYQLGRSEMFQKTIVRDRKFLLREVKKMSVYPLLSSKGVIFPIEPNIMTVYLNVNPVSISIAFHKTSTAFYDVILTGSKINPYSQLKKEMARSRSRKNFIDLDLDLPPMEWEEKKIILDKIYYDLSQYAMVDVIDTKSGAHFLLSNIQGNYTKSIDKISYYRYNGHELWQYEKFEFKRNDNESVPLPGTYQSDYKVRFYDPE